MRIDLKSLMILAHEIKGRYLITMKEAMQIAWQKAKGFSYVSCISVYDKNTRVVTRKYFYADSFDEGRSFNIGYVNEISRARFAPTYSNITVLGEVGPSRI